MVSLRSWPLFTAALIAFCVACGSKAAPPDSINPGDAGPLPDADAGADVPVRPPPPPLVDEAGFLDLPPQPTAARYAARMFYVFQAADVDSEHKPMAVFFNGGPGYPTSVGLLAYGTGRFSVDPAAPIGSPPVRNASSWTRFANLLYLDERQAGFSYGLGDARASSCVMSPVEDAADFVRALLVFLDSHPALQASPVVFVAESYGGVRVSWMLDLLLRHRTEAVKGGADLADRIRAHYHMAFPDLAGNEIDEGTASRQFGTQVLIQALVLGGFQYDAQNKLELSDPYLSNAGSNGVDPYDPYDVRQPSGWSDGLDNRALAVLSNASNAASLLGTPLTAIARLRPDARAEAFHSSLTPMAAQVAQANDALAVLLGKLSPGDSYLGFWGRQCTLLPDLNADPTIANVFSNNLRSTRTFLTHARYDSVIYTPAVPYIFQQQGWGGQIDSTPRSNVARPGWFRADMPAVNGDPLRPATSVEVRFPPYDSSGHMVGVSQPGELAADVEDWLQGQ
jgi:hypothetical protein